MKASSWLALAALVLLVRAAPAQSTIEGQVRSDSTLVGIPFAFVEIEGARRLVQGSVIGRYRIDSVPAGRYRLRARAVGFLPFELDIDVGPADTLELDLLLAADPAHQDPLAALQTGGSERLGAFYERKRRGLGRFIDREELSRNEPAPLTLVLRRLNGIRIVALPSPCLGQVLAGARGMVGTQSDRGRMVCRGAGGTIELPPACYFAVHIDGARIWEYGEPDPPDMGAISTADLEGVEIYRGATEVPQSFSGRGSRCGAIFLWSRLDDRDR